MSKRKRKRLLWRPLLTETLPYEVPVIFSNDKIYASLVADIPDNEIQKQFRKILNLQSSGYTPYSYKIGKDRTGYTDLGIVHPLAQMAVAEFYELYAQTILDYCKKSEYSLRRPSTIATAFSENELEKDATLKLGIPHVAPEEGEIDVSRITSYFTYSKVNLLHRFYDSPEFLALEKRYSRLRTLDVTKCFFNIYTHTITWAVKDRPFAKLHRNAYSFESRFDQLMQRSNSNETNGIVVGPEMSRIFAEIIFQEIDKRILNLLAQKGKKHELDYAIRRYVDDYLIFSSSESDLDLVEQVIRDELGQYKLFVNDKKVHTLSRPFVTEISLARREIAGALADLKPILAEMSDCNDDLERRQLTRSFTDRIRDIRLVVSKYGIGFHAVSGWLLGTLKPVLRQVIQNAKKRREELDQVEAIASIAASMLEVVFYVCALDLRVRTSYSLCQIVSLVSELKGIGVDEQYDRLMHIVSDELRYLVDDIRRRNIEGDSVELYNLLICGAHYIGADFVSRDPAKAAVHQLAIKPSMSYFAYITAKFCAMKSAHTFQDVLDTLNKRAKERIVSGRERVKDDSELFLMFCDFLSSPDVALREKREVLKCIVGGEVSNKTLEGLIPYLGFVDWAGMRIEHTLMRKELRPVYAWA